MVRKTPKYTLHDGFRMPHGFPAEGFRSVSSYAARPGDLFISTYPKSGTTWMQHIVWLILHRGEPLPAKRKMTEAIPHLEEVGADFVSALPAPRVIKTHLPFAMTPYHEAARYIYVIRNPFDCAVSFFHHTRGFVRHYDFAQGTFADYFECFVAGDVDFGDYFGNVLSWFVRRADANMLFLSYEEMKAEPAAAVVRVGDFLGLELGACVHDAQVLARIVEHSSFDAMAKDQGRWSSARPAEMPPFVRKGEVGDWRNHFSAEQTRRLLKRFAESPQARALQALWPELLQEAEQFAL